MFSSNNPTIATVALAPYQSLCPLPPITAGLTAFAALTTAGPTAPVAANHHGPHHVCCRLPQWDPPRPLPTITAGPTAPVFADYRGPHCAHYRRQLRAPLRRLPQTTVGPTAPVAADHCEFHRARCRRLLPDVTTPVHVDHSGSKYTDCLRLPQTSDFTSNYIAHYLRRQ